MKAKLIISILGVKPSSKLILLSDGAGLFGKVELGAVQYKSFVREAVGELYLCFLEHNRYYYSQAYVLYCCHIRVHYDFYFDLCYSKLPHWRRRHHLHEK